MPASVGETDPARTVLVTGGTGGIGAALVRRFFAAGHRVLFTYHRDEAGARRLVETLSEERVRAFPLDQGRWESHLQLVKALPEAIDVLVNNAGLGSATVERVSSDPREQDQAFMSVNALGPHWLTQALLPGMKRRGFGKIVQISSVGGGITHFPRFKMAEGMSKAALTYMSKQLAAELSHDPIDVFTVCPGATETPMFEASTLGKLSAEEREALCRSLPGGRLIAPEEVAHLVLYLCGEEGRILRGAVIDASLGLGIDPGSFSKGRKPG